MMRARGGQLARNFVAGVGTNLASAVLLFISYPICLHFIGLETYGLWLILATILTFTQLGNLGLPNALTKVVAEEFVRGNLPAVEAHLATAAALNASVALLLVAAILPFGRVVLAAFGLSSGDVAQLLALLPWALALSAWVLFVQSLSGGLAGLGRMDLANAAQLVGRLGSLVAGGILLGVGFGLPSLLIGNAFGTLATHLLTWHWMRKTAPMRTMALGSASWTSLRRLLPLGSTLLAGSVLNLLLSPFNRFIIARSFGLAAVTVFEIAYSGSMQVRALFDSGFRALIPEVSAFTTLPVAQRVTRVRELDQRSNRIVLALGVPAYLALAVLAEPLLRLWLREGFVPEETQAFRVMLAASFVGLVGVPAYYFLLALGYARCCLRAHLVQSGANVALLLTLPLLIEGIRDIAAPISVAVGFGLATITLRWQLRSVQWNASRRPPTRSQAGTT